MTFGFICLEYSVGRQAGRQANRYKDKFEHECERSFFYPFIAHCSMLTYIRDLIILFRSSVLHRYLVFSVQDTYMYFTLFTLLLLVRMLFLDF